MALRRLRRGRRSFAILAAPALAMVAVSSGCHQLGRASGPRQDRTIRAIWVTRWDYKTPGDIARVMQNCRSAGFNTVLFQVRGNGTVMYPSRLEPWAEELGGRSPGFDPLAVACKEAHRRGLSLHAWANVMPGWRGKKPPSDPRQLYNSRPDWFWRDASGRRQPLGWYNSLNPCYPEVRGYLVSVMREIVANYPVDGLHLDYIRFPNEWNESYPRGARVPDYPRDPRTLSMFRQETGETPESDPGRWVQWRTVQVTRLVRDIRAMVKRVRPGVKLTAAVGATPARARKKHFQDARQWISENLLDAVFPMNYEGDMEIFQKRLDSWMATKLRIPVVTGVMFDGRDGHTVVGQLNRIALAGGHFSAFAYNSLFDRSDRRGRPINDAGSSGRTALRKQVVPHLRSMASEQRRLAAR